MLVRLPSCAWCATSGATTDALEFILMQTISTWPLGAAHMLHPGPTCGVHQEGGVLWHRVNAFNPLVRGSLSIGPSAQAQTSTIASGPASEWGRFLQFNCNDIQYCHTELQVFLHVHQVLVACVQETKVGVNSTLKELTGYATIRHDPLTRGQGLVTLVHHRVYGCLMMIYFPMTTRWTFRHLRQTLEEPHWHSSTCISPQRPPASDFDALLVECGDQMVFGDFKTPTIPPGSPEQGMIGQRPEGSPSMGNQQFTTCRCKPRPPYLPPLPGLDILARCPSEWASPPWCDVVHPYYPWVQPPPNNSHPL